MSDVHINLQILIFTILKKVRFIYTCMTLNLFSPDIGHVWFISTTNEVEMAMLSLIEKVFEPWNYIGQSCFLY